MDRTAIDYSEFVEIADGVYWVGFFDKQAGLHCNPYLICDGDEAVLIDGGSRNDFSTVMLKIMRTGTSPDQIQRLIYHHYDPDLCGNIPLLEAIIQNENLKIISQRENNIFIKYYATKLPMQCVDRLGGAYTFASGRRLTFIRTPYSHSPGSFMTYDEKTKVLFSSDIFGSYDSNWSLYTKIYDECDHCDIPALCPKTGKRCPLHGILDFHKRIMTSADALRYALDRVQELDISIIAPQHGGLLDTQAARDVVLQALYKLDKVGFANFLDSEKGGKA